MLFDDAPDKRAAAPSRKALTWILVGYLAIDSSAGIAEKRAKICVYLLIRARCTVSYIACKATVCSGAPLLELSSYLFSKYTNFVECVNLASSLLHKSRREIRKNEA